MSTNNDTDDNFLTALMEVSGKSAPELYHGAGMLRQTWHYYIRRPDRLSKDVLTKLFKASGLSKTAFMNLLLEY